LAETVTVSADSPVVEPARVDLGRVLDAREVQNIPLVSRNPYNFALLQANVTGYENEEFGASRINANGTQMRTNYQLDGNTNTQKDRAGLRIQPASEIFVGEITLVTSGFAPEFGQTTGMVYNIVSPSGTNDIKGNFSYRFQRKDFVSRPFFLPENRPKPETHVDTFTGAIGGPIQKDRWHFYAGYENVGRDLSGDGTRVITVKPEDAARLGVVPSLGDGVVPADADAHFLIAKTDYQINPQHKLSARYTLFDQVVANNTGGGLQTLERTLDFDDRVDNVAGQLVSAIASDKLNELRVSWIKRDTVRRANDLSGTGPAVTVSGVASFGQPTGIDDFEEEIFQIVDSFTLYRGNHSFKFGGSIEFIGDYRESPIFTEYTFASTDAYLAAQSGANPRGYTTFRQVIGDPAIDYSSRFYGLYFQDDWSVTPSFKLLFGVRYDLFDVPAAVPFAANPFSNDFTIDKNNLAPRVGFAWDISGQGQTVLSAHTGIMYDSPLLDIYRDAVQLNGDPRLFDVRLNATSAGAPAFPETLSDVPSSFTLPVQSIRTVSPDYRSNYTWQSTVQVRHALSNDLSFEVAYVNSTGRGLPVQVDVNLINPVGQLADGRPIFATAVSAATRAYPAFNHIDEIQSVGESSYNALTLRLNKRFSRGLQLNSFYTLAKAEDDAPLPMYVLATTDTRLSDPTNRERDHGPTPFDVRHTWITSGVWSLLSNTQVGFVLNFNSGLPFPVRSNQDANRDGIANNDRPVGVERQSIALGWYRQVDLRISQFIRLTGRYRGEVFGEFTNLFNSENVREVNSTVAVDNLGNAVTPIPADEDFPRTAGYLQRRFQLGFKLYF